MVELGRRPVKERLSLTPINEDPDEDDGLDSEFMESYPNYNVMGNVVSILLVEYDMVYEVEDSEEEFDPKDMKEYKPMCYFKTNIGFGDEQKATFIKPDDSMKNHLKP